MKKNKYKLTNGNRKEAIPVDWTKIPEHIIEEIPGKYLFNVASVIGTGDVIEKTVVFLEPITRIPSSSKKYELDEIIIILEDDLL